MKVLEGTMASVPPQGGRKHPHQELIQIDTTNILFICGGAFAGIEKIIGNRIGKKSLGFGADISSKRDMDTNELLDSLIPQDLLKFGLIPEFVGRLPVYAKLDLLDREALIEILTEPKNSLIRQYKAMFSFDNIELEFEKEAISAIADKALERHTGARGLRSIVEEVLSDIMFDAPSEENISKVVITKECITEGASPEVMYRDEEDDFSEETDKPQLKKDVVEALTPNGTEG